jgi:hypothetical protein
VEFDEDMAEEVAILGNINRNSAIFVITVNKTYEPEGTRHAAATSYVKTDEGPRLNMEDSAINPCQMEEDSRTFIGLIDFVDLGKDLNCASLAVTQMKF